MNLSKKVGNASLIDFSLKCYTVICTCTCIHVSCKISLSIFTRIELKFMCLGERINQTFGLVPHSNDDNLVTWKPVINQT